ncbi:MAG: AmmeMemoRadiSam system protein B, partial [Spirochaetales bacterium]|nr:AmmeMemoRadiSam system protein B [Spirochaetales bacterium]
MNGHSENGKTVRPSTIEGIFYPAEKGALSTRLHDLLNHTDTAPAGNLHSIIVPHAAMDYCGSIAAPAYRAAADRDVDTVVLLGPVHREPEEAVLLPRSQVFQTPLGASAVGERDLENLAAVSTVFRVDDIPHLEEHCLEAQLPFVQHLFPRASIVPILLGRPSRSLVKLVTDALWALYEERIASTLFVVTANMTCNTDEKTSQKQAAQVIGWINSGDWQSLIEAAETKRICSCGAGCVAAILLLNSRLGGTV